MFNSLRRYIAPDSVRAVPLPTELKKEMVELICHESGLVSPHCFDQVPVISSHEIRVADPHSFHPDPVLAF
jgi:hypothetical protein